ncbi:MAG TPA: hypothetical protein VIR01_17845, partial [Pyrinomonadaceae bacterium]
MPSSDTYITAPLSEIANLLGLVPTGIAAPGTPATGSIGVTVLALALALEGTLAKIVWLLGSTTRSFVVIDSCLNSPGPGVGTGVGVGVAVGVGVGVGAGFVVETRLLC